MGSLNDFWEVVEQVFSRKIVPAVDSVYPLEQTREAYARYERGDQFGKIVLKMYG